MSFNILLHLKGQFTEKNMQISNKYMLVGYITSRQGSGRVNYHNIT